MKKLMQLAMAGTLVIASVAARAQILDPNTGMLVDPTTDPFDYMAVVSGQPTNGASEFAAQVQAQQQAQAQQQQQQDFQNSINSSNSSSDSSDDNASLPSIPNTDKPVIAPKGGSYKSAVTVTISDQDAYAMVHYTIDGSKPTMASPLYSGPIEVSANEQVRALAIADADLPSSVVTNKYKVKLP